MSLDDTVAFITVREADKIAAKARIPVQTVNSRQMPKHVKMQLTVNINTNTGPATNISQLLRLNIEDPECHTARATAALSKDQS